MPNNRTLLEQAAQREKQSLGYTQDKGETESETKTITNQPGISARSTTINSEEYDLATPLTNPTFNDTSGHLNGEYGRPRPREFWTAKQLGQTPPMELIKITVTQQLTGGNPEVLNPDGELSGGASDLADFIEDIYLGPHYQELSFDSLITTAVDDLVDLAWAYWELLPTESGEFPVGGMKPLPPLQIQHTVSDDGGDLGEDPAFWQVPYKRSGNAITSNGEAVGLERDRVVVMRAPQSARSDSLYGESIATKVREWLELILDVDVHQKRHYSDSQMPAGFLHFTGAVGKDKLGDVEDDIVEASGDPHDLVTVSTEGDVKWIPVGESVVDLEAIQEQQWYFKLVLAAAGLNSNELGIIEGSGFAKETPALQRAIYKKVTKPFMNSILQPQNSHVLPRIREGFSTQIDTRLELGLERFDPVQEQVERNETLDEWREKTVSLNEVRGALGRDAEEYIVDVPELGGEVNLADVPTYIVDKILDKPEEDGGSGNPNSGDKTSGPPDFESDPVVTPEEAFETLGYGYDERIVRALDDTIEVVSSFIESVAYARQTEFLQLEFERSGAQNAIYWYGGVEEFRFRNIIQSASKGKYFNRYIKGHYTYARIQ